MRKIFFLYFLSLILIAGNSFAQCITDPSNTTPGFTPSTLPCINQNVFYSQTVQVRVPATAVYQSISVTIDSVTFLGVNGLPSGIIPSVSPAFALPANGNGCINFSGTTNASIGNYPLTILIRVWGNVGGSPFGPLDSDAGSFGYNYAVQVCAQGGGGTGGCDTLSNIGMSDTITYYTFNGVNATGYLSGNNSYGDRAKVEKFNITAGSKVTGAFFYFSVAKTTNPARTVTFNIWTATGTGGSPGTVLATNTVPFSTLISDVQGEFFTYVPFPTEPVISGTSFFVGVVLPTIAGDTVTLWTNTFSSLTGNGWEQWNDNSWNEYVTVYNQNLGHVILPVVCSSVSAPVTNFTATVTSGCASFTTQFTDQSTNSPTSWSWSFPGGTPTSSTQQNPSVTYNTPGTYNVTLTASNAGGPNTNTKTSYITVYAKPTVTLTKTDATCTQQGSVTSNVSGGNSPYTYLWSNGGTTANLSSVSAGNYSVTVTSANNCTATASVTVNSSGGITVTLNKTDATCGLPNGAVTTSATGGSGYTYAWSNGATTANLSNISAGNFTVTVTASNGCTASASTTINTTPAITVSLNKTDASCNLSNGSITSNVSGGSGYTYLWSNSSTTANLNNLPAGAYSVTVNASNGCTASASITIVESSGGLSATTSVTTNPGCGQTNGAATVSITGGTPGYTYLWNNGQSTQNLTNIGAGAYTVTVTDANSCSTTATVNVGNVGGPSAVIQSQTNVSCHGGSNGSVTVSASGGNAPYNYSLNGVNYQASATFSGLTSGSYSFYVRDATNCIATTGANVTQPSPISIIFTKTDVTCFGLNNGNATANVTGGTAPYTYNWSNSQSGALAVNLAAASYTVVVNDNNSCTASASVTITQPAAALNAPVTHTNVNCFGESSGTATSNVSGGTTPYSYQWSNGQNTNAMTGLGAGNFSITVTDSKGCTATGSANVTQPPAALNATANATNITCNGNNNGSVSLTVSGGTTPYSYSWSNSSTNQNLNGLSSGNFAVTVTDDKNCTATSSATISEPTLLTLNATSTPASSPSAQDGSAQVAVSGGTPPYSYQWNNSANTNSTTGLAAGSYNVTVTDNNNCSALASVVVQALVGIGNTGFDGQISLFPNPTNAQAFLRIELPESRDLKIEVFNAVGSVVSAQSYVTVNQLHTTLDVHEFPAGIYFVRITSGNSSAIRKLIVAE